MRFRHGVETEGLCSEKILLHKSIEVILWRWVSNLGLSVCMDYSEPVGETPPLHLIRFTFGKGKFCFNDAGCRGRQPLPVCGNRLLTDKPQFIFPLPQDHLCGQTHRSMRKTISHRHTIVRADRQQASYTKTSPAVR